MACLVIRGTFGVPNLWGKEATVVGDEPMLRAISHRRVALRFSTVGGEPTVVAALGRRLAHKSTAASSGPKAMGGSPQGLQVTNEREGLGKTLFVGGHWSPLSQHPEIVTEKWGSKFDQSGRSNALVARLAGYHCQHTLTCVGNPKITKPKTTKRVKRVREPVHSPTLTKPQLLNS